MRSGTRDTSGWCSPGDAFTHNDILYDSHVQVPNSRHLLFALLFTFTLLYFLLFCNACNFQLATVFGSTQKVSLNVDTTTNEVKIGGQNFDAASGSAWVDGTRYTWAPRQFQVEDKLQCNDTVENIFTGNVTLFSMEGNRTMLTGTIYAFTRQYSHPYILAL